MNEKLQYVLFGAVATAFIAFFFLLFQFGPVCASEVRGCFVDPDEPYLIVSPTPTVEVTPTPTEQIEVTVTPTPTNQPKSEDKAPTFAGSSTEAPGVCPDTRPSRVANINVVTTGNKGELEVQWALPNSDRVHIEYGLEKYAQHALLNTANDGNEVIRDLTSGQHYWFRVSGVTGCAVGEPSEWFDPLVP